MRQILSLALFFVVFSGFAQIPQKYFVAFTDKNGTPYTIGNPGAFLTQRALDRRAAQGIAITEEDLPVTPSYVNQVAAIGVQVFTRCKWFNGITIRVTDTIVLSSIRALPFVQSVTRISSYNSKKSGYGDGKFRREMELGNAGGTIHPQAPGSVQSYDYGPSYNQIHMMNGDLLHNLGYRGQGKVIAVLDAGFLNADVDAVFDSLRTNLQILGTRDLVNPGGNVYLEHYHGAAVLSTMGGNVPGQLIGTAPKASYWLIRTEDANTENIVEEYTWVVGAEMADSVGADVINSSLGYTLFDNGWMDHTCADMNGTTNPSSRGANIAASKGMALSISAGNEGNSGCVSSPSDALYALSIGAVDENGNYAYFSSTGIVNGSYVKPNIATQGQNAYVGYPGGSFGYGNGTSFASPINAGMMACLWQAIPAAGQDQLRNAIQESASQYTNPDPMLGYGIPDYNKALMILTVSKPGQTFIKAYPNPFKDVFTLSFDTNMTGKVELSMVTISGTVVMAKEIYLAPGGGKTYAIKDVAALSPGMYILKITSGNVSENIRIVKTGK
ncbi:MAG: S8 family peptidase [Bacteroidetes bacterium]|nr:S8 family peptidase [Bacteroidota bacterium]